MVPGGESLSLLPPFRNKRGLLQSTALRSPQPAVRSQVGVPGPAPCAGPGRGERSPALPARRVGAAGRSTRERGPAVARPERAERPSRSVAAAPTTARISPGTRTPASKRDSACLARPGRRAASMDGVRSPCECRAPPPPPAAFVCAPRRRSPLPARLSRAPGPRPLWSRRPDGPFLPLPGLLIPFTAASGTAQQDPPGPGLGRVRDPSAGLQGHPSRSSHRPVLLLSRRGLSGARTPPLQPYPLGSGPGRRCLIPRPGQPVCPWPTEMDSDGGRRDAPGALMEPGRSVGPAGMAEPRAKAARPGPQRFLRRSVVESDQEEPPGLEAAEAPGPQPPQPLQRRVLLLCKTRRLIAERARGRPAAPAPAAPAAQPGAPGSPADAGPEPVVAQEPGPDHTAAAAETAPAPDGGPREEAAATVRKEDEGATEAKPEPGRTRRDEPEDEEDDEDDLKAVATSLDGRFLKFDIELGRGSFKTVYKGLDTETWVEVAWCELQRTFLRVCPRSRPWARPCSCAVP
ncbi:hypothetical protein P7K49_000527 [Saguinus oedipus]|uniref:Uncharacterized protein n=1 Tax=Saguinus oedipus TaxID=9490 RepID=A0ABQ9WBX8_SAGOE|nr:hypothetical protein P7K49_000527 [Saguinus oedipus]